MKCLCFFLVCLFIWFWFFSLYPPDGKFPIWILGFPWLLHSTNINDPTPVPGNTWADVAQGQQLTALLRPNLLYFLLLLLLLLWHRNRKERDEIKHDLDKAYKAGDDDLLQAQGKMSKPKSDPSMLGTC